MCVYVHATHTYISHVFEINFFLSRCSSKSTFSFILGSMNSVITYLALSHSNLPAWFFFLDYICSELYRTCPQPPGRSPLLAVQNQDAEVSCATLGQAAGECMHAHSICASSGRACLPLTQMELHCVCACWTLSWNHSPPCPPVHKTGKVGELWCRIFPDIILGFVGAWHAVAIRLGIITFICTHNNID